jgi:uncharacterized RDD family membrane protein YckC
MSADISLSPPAMPDSPLYARFSRRLKAMFIDWLLMLALIFGALALASSLASPVVSRILGFLVVAILLLYEPVLVAFTGGTLGHRWTNLRVVDEQHGGNVSFAKACARVVIKGALGLYSFLVMGATCRNQAVHDLLTRSTVRIRDVTQASSAQYITERTDTDDLPSRPRRAAVIVLYLVLVLVMYFAIITLWIAAGVLSARCVDTGVCSIGEKSMTYGLVVVYVVMSGVCIALGWRGNLFGARKNVDARA